MLIVERVVNGETLAASARSPPMSDTERAVAICDEFSAVFRDVAAGGRSQEMIDELVASIEKAGIEIARMTSRA